MNFDDTEFSLVFKELSQEPQLVFIPLTKSAESSQS